MRTNALTIKETNVNIGYETSKFAMGTIIVTAALVGLWACACMISAVLNVGVVGLIKGFLTAVIGS